MKNGERRIEELNTSRSEVWFERIILGSMLLGVTYMVIAIIYHELPFIF